MQRDTMITKLTAGKQRTLQLIKLIYRVIKKSLCVRTVHTINDLKMAITECILNVDRAILNTVFENPGVSINVWRLAGDTEHFLQLSVT
jgi:hypothetical protein